MAGRAATIEELDLVRTELERMRVRTDVLNQDIYRLNMRVGDLYELSDERFDRLEAKVDVLDAKVDALDAKVEALDAKVDRMARELRDEMKAMEERIVQRVLAALAGLQGTRN